MGSTKGENPSFSDLEKDESVLIEKVKAGDEDAFVAVYQRYQKRLRAYVYVITGSQYMADEMVQEVFLKIWAIRKQLDPSQNFDHYIFKVTKNLALNHLKKMARDGQLIKEHAARINNASNSTQDIITFKDYQRIVRDTVKKLPPQKKLVFELSRYEGKSNKEIAEELQLSVNTVQNHLGFALKTMKEKLCAAAEITLPFLPFILFI